jgi:hypothetical protein
MFIYFPPNLFSAIRTQRKSYSLMVQRTNVRVRTSMEKSNRRSNKKQHRNVRITQYCNRCCSGKAISITYSECVFLSSMECACAILSYLACPALQYFSTLSQKQHDFRKKVTKNKMCVFTFSTSFVPNI